jgi:hypothetical protein
MLLICIGIAAFLLGAGVVGVFVRWFLGEFDAPVAEHDSY